MKAFYFVFLALPSVSGFSPALAPQRADIIKTLATSDAEAVPSKSYCFAEVFLCRLHFLQSSFLRSSNSQERSSKECS